MIQAAITLAAGVAWAVLSFVVAPAWARRMNRKHPIAVPRYSGTDAPAWGWSLVCVGVLGVNGSVSAIRVGSFMPYVLIPVNAATIVLLAFVFVRWHRSRRKWAQVRDKWRNDRAWIASNN